ncbi:MAG: hypothetical protein IPO08_22590 [Xanthomonadales bacterium]|nr:hypothetical protein [Xanthomonadales bacterium]
MEIQGKRFPGVISEAFALARDGERVVLFFDELFRFNVRALDVLIGPMLPVPVPVARSMGIDTDVPVRVVRSPMWGVDYAPADNITIIAAGNPWGTQLDPALRRRFTDALKVKFDRNVLIPLTPAFRAVIDMMWTDVEVRNTASLVIEYQALTAMTRPDDPELFKRFYRRLQASDEAEAEAFKLNVSSQPALADFWDEKP